MDVIDKIGEYLRQLGLTDCETRIVSCLFMAPQMTAKEICENTGISQKNVYGMLNSLVERSLIEQTNTPLRIFTAEPQDAITKLIDERQGKLKAHLATLKIQKKPTVKMAKGLRSGWLNKVGNLLQESRSGKEEQWL